MISSFEAIIQQILAGMTIIQRLFGSVESIATGGKGLLPIVIMERG